MNVKIPHVGTIIKWDEIDGGRENRQELLIQNITIDKYH